MNTFPTTPAVDFAPVDGYRLVSLEVQNFGFYHGHHTFEMSRDGVVFTGENGAGKSTALDALRILLFEQPSFNSASTDKRKKARNVESYYLGIYGEGENTNAEGETTRARKMLRTYGSPIGPTAILARFETAAGQSLVLARLLHMPKAQAYNWRNIVTDRHITLQKILPFSSVREIQRRIAHPGSLITDNNSTYFQRMATSFSFKDRAAARPAFRMLEKAIGEKAIDSLESFARDHIFPTSNMAEVCSEVSESLQAVKKILDTLEDDRRKVEHLTKISNSFAVIEKNEELHAQARQIAQYSEVFANLLDILRQSRMISQLSGKITPIEAHVAEMAAAIESLESRIPTLRDAYRDAGGNEIDTLQARLQTAKTILDSRETIRMSFSREVQAAGLGNLPVAADVWAHLPQRLARVSRESQASAEESQKDVEKLTETIGVQKKEKAVLQAEIDDLSRTGSALGGSLVAFRAALADKLGLDADDLPFLGEMWQVQEPEWEAAANRALGEVATHILVPGRYYEEALGFLRGKQGSWGAKIDLRDADDNGRWAETHAHQNSLSTKIAVKPDHALAQAAEGILMRSADYRCVTTNADLKSGRAITVDGTTSFGKGHARRDDRASVANRSSWVIGWNSESRKRALEAEIEIIQTIITNLNQDRTNSQAGHTVHAARASAAKRAAEQFQPFVLMDVQGPADEITTITTQISNLRNGRLGQTKADLEYAEAALKEKRDAHITANNTMSALESARQVARETLQQARTNAREQMTKIGQPITLRLARILVNIGLSKTPKGGETSTAHPGAGVVSQKIQVSTEVMMREIRSDKDTRIGLSDRRIRENADRAKQLIDRFLSQWPNEAGKTLSRRIDDLQEGPLNRKAWRDRLQQIEYHDIKSLEGQIESRDRTTIFASLPKIWGCQQDYAGEIDRLQSGINEVLARTIYDQSKDSYARLEIRQKINPIAKEFRDKVKACVTDMIEMTNEDIYRHAKEFIDYIEDQDPTTRAERQAKALDLRQWYTIRLVEYRPLDTPDDSGNTEEVLNILSGSSTASGGEAERLSSFFMGAGLSHAFGTCDPWREKPPLQLFIVDEAFKHCTDDTAQGAMTFLKRLGMQLVLASPIEKVSAFEGFADRFFTVSKEDNQSFAQPIAYEEIDAQDAISTVQLDIGENQVMGEYNQ